MFTPAGLFARRVRAEWKYQWSVFRLAVDWIVALYIVIPACAVLVYQYVRLWQAPPAWFDLVPLSSASALLFILLSSGTFRFFLEEADQLILLQHPRWHRALKRRGSLYSLALQAAGSAFGVVVFAPLLAARFGFTPLMLALYAAFALGLRMSRQCVAHEWETRFDGFSNAGLRALLFSAAAGLFAAGTSLIAAAGPPAAVPLAAASLAAMAALLRRRMRLRGTFHADVEREQRARMALAGILLRGVLPRPPKRRRRKPLLFPSSRRLFRAYTQENGLAEAAVKTWLRDGVKLRLYWQMTLAGVAAELLLPFPMRVIVGAVLNVLLAFMVMPFAAEAAEHDLAALFRWRETSRVAAVRKAVLAMTWPGMLAWCGAFAVRSGAVSLAFTLPAGLLLAWLSARLAAYWYRFKFVRNYS